MFPRPTTLLLLGLALTLPCGRGWAGTESVPENPPPARDPLVVDGQLPNGLRYALRPQPVPPGRLSMFLYVAAGSGHEHDEELGYAHFVEHLAFAGTRDFPGDGVIRTLQRFGLAFGSEINAATGRTYTVYELKNVPAGDPAAVATALQVLRNYADGLLFDPDAVRRERGVILSEGRVREGRIAYWWERGLEFLPPFREELTDREMETVFAGAAIARPQIGSPRSIRRATPEGLRAFYDRWYRPERMVLAVAGEFDPRKLVTQVGAAFGGCAARGPAPQDPGPEVVPAMPRDDLPVVFTDPEAPGAIVALAGVARTNTSPAVLRARVEESVAAVLLERRLCRTIPVSAQVESVLAHEAEGWQVALLRARIAPTDWEAAAVALEAEVRRVALLGFTPEELAAAVEVHRRRVSWSERDAANRKAEEVAQALAQAYGRGEVFSSAAEERRYLEVELARLTSETCRAAVARLWPAGATRLIVSGPMEASAVRSRSVRRALAAVRVSEPEPYSPGAEIEARLPERFGVPGEVVYEEHNPGLDCWLVQFGNGVRLNFKATTFEHGRVRLRVAFGGGLLGTEPGREGLAFAIAALHHGTLDQLTREQERELLARGEILTSFGFGADRFGLAANCPADGLDTALRLFTARLAAEHCPPGGDAHTRAFIEEQLTRFDRTSAGLAEDRLREYMFGDHHALTRPRREATGKLSFSELRRWIEPQMHDSPIEITIVGDIGLDEVTATVARTFGALPLRSTVDPMADRRLFVPGATPMRQELRFRGKNSVGTVALAWRLPDVVGQQDDCRMRLLAGVLEDRIRVRLRQEMGRTYSPVVGLLAERALAPAMLILRCRIETAPKYLERVVEAANGVVEALVRDGIADDELARAREPLVRQAEDNRASNKWWMSVLDEAQTKPQYLEEQGEQVAILKAATREELQDLARLLFSEERRCELVVAPE